MGRVLLNEQNSLNVTKVTCRWSLNLDTLASDTSIARKHHQLRLEKKYFSYKTKSIFGPYFKIWRTHTLFWIRYINLCCSKWKSFWESRTWHKGKKIFALINEWENIIAYWKNASKARHWVTSVICFIL